MTVHRTALRLAGLAAVSALWISGCSSNVTDAEPAASSESLSSRTDATTTTTTTEIPTPTTTVDVPSGVVGSGCAGYIEKVPSGPGSLIGMAVDPVGIAVSNSPQLTSFAGAISGKVNSDANLFDVLNKGTYTVFVPTDDAFGKLDPAALDKLRGDPTELTAVLKYHVVNGELDPSAVVGEHKTLQGQSLTVSGSGEGLHVNNAGLVCGGIKTGNATVYLLDTVLMPPPPAPPASTSGTPTSGEAAPGESGTGATDSSGSDASTTATTTTTPTS